VDLEIIFFENLAKHILSKKYNLKNTYLYYNEFEFIGIKLFIDGENYYDTIYQNLSLRMVIFQVIQLIMKYVKN
jgi:hypothetical protein